MGAQYMGLQTRMMSQTLRKLTAISAKSHTMIIFMMAPRKIGVMFEIQKRLGGRAKFYSSVRVDVRQTPDKTRRRNHRQSRRQSQKQVAPRLHGEFDILSGEGISYEGRVATSS